MKLITLLVGLILSLNVQAKGDIRFNPEFNFFAQANMITKWTPVRIYGRNSSCDALAEESIWEGGGKYVFPTNTTTTIISNSANDASGGTGCNQVYVTGLNSNYDQISETVTMNGTSGVDLSNNFFRVNSMECTLSGSLKTNEGTIQLKQGSTEIDRMPAEYGIGSQAIYTVPAGYKLVIFHVDAQIQYNVQGAAEMKFRTFDVAKNTWKNTLMGGVMAVGTSWEPFSVNNKSLLILDPKTDIDVRCNTASASALNIGVTIEAYLTPSDNSGFE